MENECLPAQKEKEVKGRGESCSFLRQEGTRKETGIRIPRDRIKKGTPIAEKGKKTRLHRGKRKWQ